MQAKGLSEVLHPIPIHSAIQLYSNIVRMNMDYWDIKTARNNSTSMDIQIFSFASYKTRAFCLCLFWNGRRTISRCNTQIPIWLKAFKNVLLPILKVFSYTFTNWRLLTLAGGREWGQVFFKKTLQIQLW